MSIIIYYTIIPMDNLIYHNMYSSAAPGDLVDLVDVDHAVPVAFVLCVVQSVVVLFVRHDCFVGLVSVLLKLFVDLSC